jgi:hypothetical protein
MTMTISVLKEVTALPSLTIDDLKTKWCKLFDSDPPPYNKAFLIRRLAYRLQELAHGGLSEITKERLKCLSTEEGDPPRQQVKTFQGDGPVTGTRLMREWKGIDHCVTVLEDGFDYEGQKFRSLSAVARAITGTRWNGKLFFGLKKNGGYS